MAGRFAVLITVAEICGLCIDCRTFTLDVASFMVSADRCRIESFVCLDGSGVAFVAVAALAAATSSKQTCNKLNDNPYIAYRWRRLIENRWSVI